MVKKVNAHLQKTRKLQSASEAPKRDVYDDLLDDMSTEQGIPFEALLRPYAWEKQGDQWGRKKEK
jgi:hypothetical protein|tara:strand:- start:490 stop:684 length:195 start_codon:yes stop_codon:yes gene_type:complete